MRSFLIGLGALSLAGCPVLTEETAPDCTAMAASSVNLSVVDPDGDPVEGASATYTVDGGDPADCEEMPGGGFVCGWEVEGRFVVVASAPGYFESSGETTVRADECHVTPKSLAVVLEPVDCTADVAPSVLVAVTSSDGQALTGVSVRFSEDGAAFEPCGGQDASWVCGEEVSGSLTVEASADGHQTAQQVVEVGADECHVITESVELVLDPA